MLFILIAISLKKKEEEVKKENYIFPRDLIAYVLIHSDVMSVFLQEQGCFLVKQVGCWGVQYTHEIFSYLIIYTHFSYSFVYYALNISFPFPDR